MHRSVEKYLSIYYNINISVAIMTNVMSVKRLRWTSIYKTHIRYNYLQENHRALAVQLYINSHNTYYDIIIYTYIYSVVHIYTCKHVCMYVCIYKGMYEYMYIYAMWYSVCILYRLLRLRYYSIKRVSL